MKSGALEFGGNDKINVRMRVTNALADILSETPLSAAQEIVSEGDSYLVTAEVHDTWQLEWWLLSQGGAIEVVSPIDLRERMVVRISELAAAYHRKD